MTTDIRVRGAPCSDARSRLLDWAARGAPGLAWIEPWPALGERAPPPLTLGLPELDCTLFEARLFRADGGLHIRALDPGRYRWMEYRFAAEAPDDGETPWRALHWDRLATAVLPIRRDWARFGLRFAGPGRVERSEYWSGPDLVLWHLRPLAGEGGEIV